jgi:uncharacterized protein YabN with tetrapyrrole methylase and pyrophosphatase domain
MTRDRCLSGTCKIPFQLKTHIGCNFDDNKIDYTKKRYLLHKKYEYKSKINIKNLQHIINKQG